MIFFFWLLYCFRNCLYQLSKVFGSGTVIQRLTFPLVLLSTSNSLRITVAFFTIFMFSTKSFNIFIEVLFSQKGFLHLLFLLLIKLQILFHCYHLKKKLHVVSCLLSVTVSDEWTCTTQCTCWHLDTEFSNAHKCEEINSYCSQFTQNQVILLWQHK